MVLQEVEEEAVVDDDGVSPLTLPPGLTAIVGCVKSKITNMLSLIEF